MKISPRLLAPLLGWAILSMQPAVAATRGEQMGVFTDLREEATAPEIEALGLGWVRIMYAWTWIEPEEGKMIWFELDQWIARAKAHHLKVLLVAHGSPAWANGGHGPYDPQPGLNTPPLPQYYGRFAHYAAELARHGADAVEIWNEPNGGFWLPAPDAKGWANLVCASYDAVKAVNPNALVIAGGVCPVAGGAADPNSPVHFIEAALKSNPALAQRFDAVGHHPYVFANDPAAKDPLTAPYQWNAILQTPAIHEALARYGAGEKPFWFTEYGVPTGGPFGAVTPAESAVIYQHYFDAFDRLTAGGIKLGPIFFFSLHDSQPMQQANALEGWEGIYDLHGAEKPSVAVIRARAASAR